MDTTNSSQTTHVSSLDALQPALDRVAQYRTPIPAAFAVIVIFFFFGFCNFKCNGTKVASLKGINLVTGTHLRTQVDNLANGNIFANSAGKSSGQKILPNFWAILAFFSAIGGFFAFYKKAKKEVLIGTVLGSIGFISLLILRLVIKSKVENQSGGMVSIDVGFTFTYWVCVLSFLVAGGISYLRFRRENEADTDTKEKGADERRVTPIQVNIITKDFPSEG